MSKQKIYTNANGIRIPKICASCQHCPVPVDENQRTCKLMDLQMPADFTCNKWQVNRRCNIIGCTELGRIKKKEYLMDAFRHACCHDVSIAPASAKTELFRELWEAKNHTSIYIEP